MEEFTVEIEETVSKLFTVKASSREEALRIARKNYHEAGFVLEPGQLMDVKFAILSLNDGENDAEKPWKKA